LHNRRPGVSTHKASIVLYRLALTGRSAVIPEDIQCVLPGLASHRLQSMQDAQTMDGDKLMRELIEAVAIP